jgi:hypothetical protein
MIYNGNNKHEILAFCIDAICIGDIIQILTPDGVRTLRAGDEVYQEGDEFYVLPCENGHIGGFIHAQQHFKATPSIFTGAIKNVGVLDTQTRPSTKQTTPYLHQL